MKPDLPKGVSRYSVSAPELIKLAKGLKSEDGENPEYDRALVELVSDAVGLHVREIAKLLGIRIKRIYPGL